MWKKKDQRKLAELRMQMHSKPKARQHVSARPVRNHAFCSVGRTRADFPDDLLSVATSCLDLSASLNGRGAPISPRHSPVCATNTREERILFLTRAQAVLARACSKGCSRRVEFSLSSLSFPPPFLSLSLLHEGGFLPADLYAPCFIRVLRSIDRDARGDPGATWHC